ncbi:hypothetical protein IMSHALPRED_004692 [Imshaugia aleurites]|uniref:Uncharacterized protein n=1 Tax=Imshaugia aleurites TaxID=172621 RepID=A0A8H3F8G7_9LECA|nr:hypothetical protein IMSHALPRED_004692 [Imshaugia aleurites]
MEGSIPTYWQRHRARTSQDQQEEGHLPPPPLASAFTSTTIDMNPTPAPGANFYSQIGTPKSDVTHKRENIQKGLRFSNSLMTAITSEIERRLQQEGI